MLRMQREAPLRVRIWLYEYEVGRIQPELFCLLRELLPPDF
jgi:hypothetical protein